MKNKQLVSTGIILALLGSNIIIGHSYIKDTEKFQKETQIQYKIIEQNKKKQTLLEEKSVKNTEKITNLSIKNSLLTDELNKVKLENNQLKTENGTLKNQKQQLQNRLSSLKFYEVTAYTAGFESTQKQKGDEGYGVTASGTTVKQGRTIACPSSLKFGTKVNIEGIGLRVCEDRGGAIKTGHIDLYVENVNQALEFGRKKLLVEIIN
jgi:3D (Asp-Asp-Asp) domain-containing protein